MDKRLYEDKLDAQLQEWNAQLELLKEKAAQAEASAKLPIQQEIDQLEERQRGLRRELEELRQLGGEEGWERLKAGLNQARDETVDALEELAAKLR